MLNTVLEGKPATSTTHYHFCLDVMAWLRRHGCEGKPAFELHIAACKGHFVDTMLEAWKLCKASTPTLRLQWFNTQHKDLLGMIFAPAELHTIFTHLAEPKKAKQQIYKLVAANLLGKALFNETLQALLSQECGDAIRACVEKELKGKKLTPDLWRDVSKLAIAAAAAVDPRGIMASRRTALVMYRGLHVHVRVSSVLAEVECWLSAKAKEVAVEAAGSFNRHVPPPFSFLFFVSVGWWVVGWVVGSVVVGWLFPCRRSRGTSVRE